MIPPVICGAPGEIAHFCNVDTPIVAVTASAPSETRMPINASLHSADFSIPRVMTANGPSTLTGPSVTKT